MVTKCPIDMQLSLKTGEKHNKDNTLYYTSAFVNQSEEDMDEQDKQGAPRSPAGVIISRRQDLVDIFKNERPRRDHQHIQKWLQEAEDKRVDQNHEICT